MCCSFFMDYFILFAAAVFDKHILGHGNNHRQYRVAAQGNFQEMCIRDSTLSVKKSDLISDQMVQETIDEYLASKATLNESSTRITANVL